MACAACLPMFRAILIGMMAGMRSLTPLAVASTAARRDRLPADNGAPAFLAWPVVSNTVTALAAGELLGDKMRSAPDRIILPGILARTVTGAVAAMAVAPRRDRHVAAALGAAAAVGAAYLSFGLRRRAMQQHGQRSTGLLEDALALVGSIWVIRG
jgi:uncharacterized membrane protein